jgi:hypothetical protein
MPNAFCVFRMHEKSTRVGKLALEMGDARGLSAGRLLDEGQSFETIGVRDQRVCEAILQLRNVRVRGVVGLFYDLIGSGGAGGAGIAEVAMLACPLLFPQFDKNTISTNAIETRTRARTQVLLALRHILRQAALVKSLEALGELRVAGLRVQQCTGIVQTLRSFTIYET